MPDRLRAPLALCLVAAAASVAVAQEIALTERECLARAMYFESDRSESDGMLAVGTVVANRLASGRYGTTICEVVGRPAQFAPGVLSRPMREPKPTEMARAVADAVLAGRRHPVAGRALYFHTANAPFRKIDKSYLLVSGGNAFYRWNRTAEPQAKRQNAASFAFASVSAGADEAVGELALAAIGPADASAPRAPRPEVAAHAPLSPTLAFAYRAEPERTREARAALAAVARFGHASGARRVVSPTAPVLAGSLPVAAAPAIPPAPSLFERANRLVAAAWAAFS